MKYYSVSPIQKLDIAVSVCLFIILFGFARTILLGQYLDSKNVFFLTILFFIWLFLTRIFTNAVMFQYIYNKLNPYDSTI